MVIPLAYYRSCLIITTRFVRGILIIITVISTALRSRYIDQPRFLEQITIYFTAGYQSPVVKVYLDKTAKSDIMRRNLSAYDSLSYSINLQTLMNCGCEE